MFICVHLLDVFRLKCNTKTYKSGLVYITIATVLFFCISQNIYTSFEIGNIPFLYTTNTSSNVFVTTKAIITNISFQLLGKTIYVLIFILFTNGVHLLFKFSLKRKKYILWLIVFTCLTSLIINIITPIRLSNYYAGGCLGYIFSKLLFIDLFKQQEIYFWQLLSLIFIWLLFFPYVLSLNVKAIINKTLKYIIKNKKYTSLGNYQKSKLLDVLRIGKQQFSTNNKRAYNHSTIFPSKPTKKCNNNLHQNNSLDYNNNRYLIENNASLVGNNPHICSASEVDEYQLPDISLLNPINIDNQEESGTDNSELLLQALEEFSIKGEIVNINHGPVVTVFEFKPDPGIKIARIISLNEDIAREISAISIRIAKLPGKNVLGIEVPNENRKTVYFRQILNNDDKKAIIPLFLGQDVLGKELICDLTKMPHLLIAGTTGSGKSVSINTMILSILFKFPPDKCKFIMIDPKMLELSIYNNIPHLLTQVVTDPKKAVTTLNWAVGIMEKRYRQMSQFNVRNIESFNSKLLQAKDNPDLLVKKIQVGFDNTGAPKFETHHLDFEYMPYIVIVIDELADLMLVAGKSVEESIRRLSQMARAAGIHLILATQRPSVDVITGTIKANLPTRISFQVASKIDSRTILGDQGAEQLLGQGDMLYMPGASKTTRIHGAYVSDNEIERIVEFIKSQGVLFHDEQDQFVNENASEDIIDHNEKENRSDLYNQAVNLVIKNKKCSVNYIQKNLNIGYNEASRLLEKMEQQGIVSPPSSSGKRTIL